MYFAAFKLQKPHIFNMNIIKMRRSKIPGVKLCGWGRYHLLYSKTPPLPTTAQHVPEIFWMAIHSSLFVKLYAASTGGKHTFISKAEVEA